jgi:hypothetical protein
MGKTVTKAELSELVGRDERTLTRWQNDGMPVLEFGQGRGNENYYDTEAVLQWLMHQASLNGKKESARDRLDRVRADREELALAKDLDELVIAADLIQRFEAMVTSAKVELINTFPDELAADLSARYGIEVDEQLIRDPIETILRRLSEYDDEEALSAGDPDEPEDSESSDEGSE